MKRLKELLVIAIIASILPMNFIVKAEEKSDDSEINCISEKTVQENNQEIKEYVYESSDGQIYTEVIGNTIYMYDDNHNLIMSAQYEVVVEENSVYTDEEENSISTAALIDDYDQWKGWKPTDIVRVTPKFSTDTIVESTFEVLIDVVFKENKITILKTAIKQFCKAVYKSIKNNTTIYLKGDYNYNKYCDILRKERVNQYNSNGSVKHYGSAVTNWLNTPWDYTTHASCRVLTQRY